MTGPPPASRLSDPTLPPHLTLPCPFTLLLTSHLPLDPCPSPDPCTAPDPSPVLLFTIKGKADGGHALCNKNIAGPQLISTHEVDLRQIIRGVSYMHLRGVSYMHLRGVSYMHLRGVSYMHLRGVSYTHLRGVSYMRVSVTCT